MTTYPRPRHFRSPFRAVARAALAPLCAVGGFAACAQPSQPPDAAAHVCSLAREAATSATEGVTNQTMSLTAELLDVAANLPAEDVMLLYWVSYVGDAYRGSDPAMALPSVLTDLATECEAS